MAGVYFYRPDKALGSLYTTAGTEHMGLFADKAVSRTGGRCMDPTAVVYVVLHTRTWHPDKASRAQVVSMRHVQPRATKQRQVYVLQRSSRQKAEFK